MKYKELKKEMYKYEVSTSLSLSGTIDFWVKTLDGLGSEDVICWIKDNRIYIGDYEDTVYTTEELQSILPMLQSFIQTTDKGLPKWFTMLTKWKKKHQQRKE